MAFQAGSPLSSLSFSNRCTLNLYSAAQVRELDRCAIEDFGIPGIVLMKRAGQAILDEILERNSDFKNGQPHITIFCGAGNNGGDGYIVAGLAKQKNIEVCLIETSGNKTRGDAQRARGFALSQNVIPVNALEWLKAPDVIDGTVIVDALLGTGFSGDLRKPYADLITCINQSEQSVFAADIPSGLCADTGAVVEQAVRANVTVTFIGMKLGLFTGQGRNYSGDIVFDGLKVVPDVYQLTRPKAEILGYDWLMDALVDLLPERDEANHKGHHGHVVIVGGDLGFGGAPLMAAEAAARTGAGLVSIVTRSEHRATILARRPEIMVCDAGDASAVQEVLSKATVIVVGPGLGTNAWGQKLLQSVLLTSKPMVVDADALNILASGCLNAHLSSLRLQASVITPHPGEASRLLNVSTQQINQDRIAAVERLQKQFSSVVLLKGSGTLIGASIGANFKNEPDDLCLSLCPYGNPGMGSGGMGDVLSGIIGSLMAQGINPDQSAKLGACAHACAADNMVETFGERGLMATDLIDEVRRLINGF